MSVTAPFPYTINRRRVMAFAQTKEKFCKHKHGIQERVNDILFRGEHFRQIKCLRCGEYRVRIELSEYHPALISEIYLSYEDAYVYALVNPVNGQIFYVGSTHLSLKTTLNRHIKGCYQALRNAFKNSVIRKILSDGKEPGIKLLKKVKIEEQYSEESRWISRLSKKHSLTNIKA